MVNKIYYNERVLYNTSYMSYGSAYDINLKFLKRVNILLSILLIGVYPIVASVFINSLFKDVVKWRFD